MALFGGKKENKFYIVMDPYSEEATASCETREVKQILGVLPTALFIECSSYEFFKYKEHNVLPDDFTSRPRLTAKDVK
ncbi:MAG: hypothetical protein ACI4GW_03505 [Lachnospiraceae bacterium]